jgi:predicted TPR repeat methyltransferase
LRSKRRMDAITWQETAQKAENEGQTEAAITAWRELLWLRPHDRMAVLALSKLYQNSAQIKPALELLQAAVRHDYEFSAAHAVLGELYMELAEWDKAQKHFEHAGLPDALARLDIARQQLPASYARHLFNDYAPKFDDALAGLGYQAPALIAKTLAPYVAGKTDLHILDLGCGTGLMAPLLRAHAARLVGVDIAENMLLEAKKRGGYDELIHADVLEALGGAYDFMIAADVLVYVGDLAPLIAHLPRPCFFVASVEVNGLTEGYRLQESKRYAHSESYIKSLCRSHNCHLSSWEAVILRQDRQQPIHGAIFVIHAQ